MALGIQFDEANTVLRAPAQSRNVYDLHVHRYRDGDGQDRLISKWQFTPDELADLVASEGVFWFHCEGHTHPPIAIGAAYPFAVPLAIPRALSVDRDDPRFDDEALRYGSTLMIRLNGAEQHSVLTYDQDQGFVVVHEVDGNGELVLDPGTDNVRTVTRRGTVEVTRREHSLPPTQKSERPPLPDRRRTSVCTASKF